MRLGIYSDLRNPAPWRRPFEQLYGRVLDRVVQAERLGLGSFWLTEHHLFEDGYLPQPLTFAAAVAARTSTLRIGTAVMLAPLRPPLAIAEEAAVVDIISGGRLDLGLGAGYRIPEYEAYGADISRRFSLLEQRAREVRRLWEEGICTPPPSQRRPPLWLGVMGPRGARMAGRLGEGLLWLSRDLLVPYREGLQEAGLDPACARMAGLANIILADDPEAAWPRIRPHLAWQRETYNRYAAEGRAQGAGATGGLAGPRTLDAGGVPADPERLRGHGRDALPPRLHVLSPADALALLREWLAGMPVVDVFFWESIAGMPDDLADRHLELLAGELAPALAGES